MNTGRFKESIDALSEIDRKTLPESLINNYFIAYEEGYSGLAYNAAVNQVNTVCKSNVIIVIYSLTSQDYNINRDINDKFPYYTFDNKIMGMIVLKNAKPT